MLLVYCSLWLGVTSLLLPLPFAAWKRCLIIFGFSRCRSKKVWEFETSSKSVPISKMTKKIKINLVVVLIYFGYTVTGPYALNTTQFIHLKIVAKNYEQVRSKISMLTVGDQWVSDSRTWKIRNIVMRFYTWFTAQRINSHPCHTYTTVYSILL